MARFCLHVFAKRKAAMLLVHFTDFSVRVNSGFL